MVANKMKGKLEQSVRQALVEEGNTPSAPTYTVFLGFFRNTLSHFCCRKEFEGAACFLRRRAR